MVSEPLASRKASISVSDIYLTLSRLFVTKDTACGGLDLTQDGVRKTERKRTAVDNPLKREYHSGRTRAQKSSRHKGEYHA